uniref:Ganglioside induced differentiation associated protein n=1 Tax=Sphaerodactylus townsendi TaxID=933632 RepID=A0ACB8F656_9SAUR
MPLTEHKEPWFMRLNLGEEVPVIIHGDNIISDYNQIIDYMEKTFTGEKESREEFVSRAPKELNKDVD